MVFDLNGDAEKLFDIYLLRCLSRSLLPGEPNRVTRPGMVGKQHFNGLAVISGKEHPLTFHSSQPGGFQVANQQDISALEFIGPIIGNQPGDDLAGLSAQIDSLNVQLISLRVFFHLNDLGYSEIHPGTELLKGLRI